MAPDDNPTTTSSVHIPSENTNRYRNPSPALFVDDTHVSTAAITGAEHGAATRPDMAPMRNAPDARPAVPVPLALARSACGTRTGMTSSIASAAKINTLAIAKYSHGLLLMEPNSVPDIPANRPSAA